MEKVDPKLCKQCGYKDTPLCTHPTGEYKDDDKDLTELIKELKNDLHKEMAFAFKLWLTTYGDTHKTRLQIVNYTMGYMGASYGIKVD
jgi:hypothetical protein